MPLYKAAFFIALSIGYNQKQQQKTMKKYFIY